MGTGPSAETITFEKLRSRGAWCLRVRRWLWQWYARRRKCRCKELRTVRGRREWIGARHGVRAVPPRHVELARERFEAGIQGEHRADSDDRCRFSRQAVEVIGEAHGFEVVGNPTPGSAQVAPERAGPRRATELVPPDGRESAVLMERGERREAAREAVVPRADQHGALTLALSHGSPFARGGCDQHERSR